MIEGSSLLKMVQEKLAEKEEIIHEQQRQIEDLQQRLRQAPDGGAASDSAENDALIHEQMKQIVELTEKVEKLEAAANENAQALDEKEEVLREQMNQILEYTDNIVTLESRIAELEENQKEFNALQKQLQELLGES